MSTYHDATENMIRAYRELLRSLHADLVYRRQGKPEGATALMTVLADSAPFRLSPSTGEVEVVPALPLSVALLIVAGCAEALHGTEPSEFEHRFRRLRWRRRDVYEFERPTADHLGQTIERQRGENERADHQRRFLEIQSIGGLALELVGQAHSAARSVERGEVDDAALLGAVTVAGALVFLLMAPDARIGDRHRRSAAENASRDRDPTTRDRHDAWVAHARELRGDHPDWSTELISRVIFTGLAHDGVEHVAPRTIANVLSRRRAEWDVVTS